VTAKDDGDLARLGDIATELRTFQQPELALLADELDAGGGAVVGVDLLTAFSPDALLPEPGEAGPGDGTLHRWERARDVLVFLPIGLTWYELAMALRHYDGTEPFLLEWQHGHLPFLWPLSVTAILVVLLVAAIITATVRSHALQRAAQEAAEPVAKRRRRLAGLLAQATVLLARSVMRGPEVLSRAELRQFAAGMDIFAQQQKAGIEALSQALTDTATEIKTTLESGPGSRLATALDEWSLAAVNLAEVGEGLKAPSTTLAELTTLQESVTREGERLQSLVSSLVAQLGDHTEASADESAAHRDMATKVARTTEQVHQAMELLLERLGDLGDFVGQVRAALERLENDPYGWNSGDGYPDTIVEGS
jgi:hypothetical protein